MLSSRPLKAAVLGLAVIAGGCDRQSGEQAQPQATASGSESAAPTGQGQPPKGVLDTSHKDSQMPDFTLTDPAGRQLRLADLKGSGDNAATRDMPHDITLYLINRRVSRFAYPGGIFSNHIQHWLNIRRRACDDAQNLARRGLLL